LNANSVISDSKVRITTGHSLILTTGHIDMDIKVRLIERQS
jgi:hypothetical protein